MPLSEKPVARWGTAVLVASIGSLLMGGCTPTPADEPVETTRTPSAAVTPSEEGGAPTLKADGTARENLPLFADVIERVWVTQGSVQGLVYVDALAAAGFDRLAMQATKDQTTLGSPAESIQFSVLWGTECLIGQVGPEVPAPVTVVLPALESGGCLVGETQPL